MNLELRGICKRFGSVLALQDVNLDIRGGEVLALLGENGAGKSTLMKILYGVERADAGVITVDSARVFAPNPRAARAAGIGMVFQQWSLIPALTVAENLMLSWPDRPRWLGRRARAWHQVLHRLREIAPEIDPRTRAADLSVGEKQLVELVKVLNMGARTLLLDEPTSVLARPEAERLWAQVRALAATGAAIVLITHKLEDVQACADRVVVLRAGRLAGETRHVADHGQIVTWMMGAALPNAATRSSSLRGEPSPRLVLREVVAESAGARLECPALTVAAGEVLGVAGVTGNGQELFGRLLAGVAVPRKGQVLLDGRELSRGQHGHRRVANGEGSGGPVVAYIPEQPLRNGCAPDLSVMLNLTALEARRLRWVPRWAAARQRAAALMEEFDVRPRDLEMPSGNLSGGNLQKLVVGREVSRQPDLVVACYPTMGLDIAAAAAVVAQLLACAARGAAVIWISEDLDLLLERADRVAVLHKGRLLGPIPVDQATRHGLGAWMTGAAA